MNKRVGSIDSLRTISILAVLLIHTTTKVLELTHYDLINYQTTLFLNQVGRFAVPLFFLISGFVLELSSSDELNYWSYIKKRFSKIVIPYVFWSLVYYFLIYNQNQDNFVRVLLTGDASYQLYFIPTLCMYYLIFPILHKFYKWIANIPVMAIIFISQLLLMRQDYFLKQFSLADPLRIFVLSYFFFITGMVAAKNKDIILGIVAKIKYYLFLAVPFIVYYIFNEGMVRYFETYNIKAFYSQWRPSVLIYTLILGSLLFYIFQKYNRFKILEKLSKFSYLVFFVHVIFLELVWRYFAQNLFNSIGNNVIGKTIFDPLFFILVVALSFGSGYLIHKVPNLSKITG